MPDRKPDVPDSKPDDLGFDHESPDLEDPQVDPPVPATPPADEKPGNDYPPYGEKKD